MRGRARHDPGNDDAQLSGPSLFETEYSMYAALRGGVEQSFGLRNDTAILDGSWSNVNDREETRSLLSYRSGLFGRRRRTNQAAGTSCSKDNNCKDKACGRTGRRRGKPKICCPGGNAKTDFGVGWRWCTNQPENEKCNEASQCASGLTCRITLCSKRTHPKCNDLGAEADTVCVKPVEWDSPKRSLPYKCSSDDHCLHKCGKLSKYSDAHHHKKYCCPFQGSLYNGYCRNYVDGMECKHDDQCASGLCSNKDWNFGDLTSYEQCMAKRSSGEYCSKNKHCQSGKCKIWQGETSEDGWKCCPSADTVFQDMVYKCVIT